MNQPTVDELFEKRIIYPDPDCKDRLDQLVGLDSHKETLMKTISLTLNQSGVEKWVKKYHPKARKSFLNMIFRKSPLIVLEGDVGCGKSELAETAGDAVARKEGIDITLFPLSLSTRGKGRVGEMTQLLSIAFDYIISEAEKLKQDNDKYTGALIFLIDEADALAQSRETEQMHHEDRAGVNAFIRGIDRIKNKKIPATVIMCTNRVNSLDPAIKRRSTDILTFQRPNKEQRFLLLNLLFEGLEFSEKDIKTISEITGDNNRSYGFTFSDLTQKLLFKIIIDAYPDKKINPRRAVEITRSIVPTPPFKEK